MKPMTEERLDEIEGEVEIMPESWFFKEFAINLISEIRRLQERKKELAAEKEKWRVEALRKYPTPDAYDAACKALNKHRKQNRKLAEGLQFYAHPFKQNEPSDEGRRAREILRECGLWEDEKE